MVDRVYLGDRNGEYGLWISKPGKDVKTAGVNDLLFSSSTSAYKYGQVLAGGTYTFPSTAGATFNVNVQMPIGKRPYVMFFSTEVANTFVPVDAFVQAIEVSTAISGNNATVTFYKYGTTTPTIVYQITSAEL